MDKPEIFLSCVTSEFGSTRQAVANALVRLGYTPIFQEIFGFEQGDLRQVLRDKIDRCEGIIQIIGDAYGAEPPTVDPDYGRVSYTQFEFFYARMKGKKTWLIVAKDGCERDKPLDQLDLPTDSDYPDPAAYQAERREWQRTYREARERDKQVYYYALDERDLVGKIKDMRDELALLRRRFARWQALVVVLLLLILAGLGSWALWFRRTAHRTDEHFTRVLEGVEKVEAHVAAAQQFSPASLRAQLQHRASKTRQVALAEAERAADGREQERLRKVAEQDYAAKLAKIEEAIDYCQEVLNQEDASIVFQEMVRIQSEEGLDAALAFVESRRRDILAEVRSRNAAAALSQERNRVDLQPLLASAQLHEAEGRYEEADEIYNDLLSVEPSWPVLLHHHFWFLIGRSDRALTHENLGVALKHAEAAEADAIRLTSLEPDNLGSWRDLMASQDRIGDIQATLGQVEAARETHSRALAITERLAASDPANAVWQGDLLSAYNRMGDLEAESGNLEEARQQYTKMLAVAERLAVSEPNNTKWQRGLSLSYGRTGDMDATLGSTEEARESYVKALAIAEQLSNLDSANAELHRDLGVLHLSVGDLEVEKGSMEAAQESYSKSLAIFERVAVSDPSNAQWQRDLSLNHDRIGNMEVELGRIEVALEHYHKSIAITTRLAESDPANMRWQRDLSVGYNKIGDMEAARGWPELAQVNYQLALEIREQLAALNPDHAQLQWDLSVSHSKIGNIEAELGRIEAARESYHKTLVIRERLLASDPASPDWQRDFSVSLNRMGDIEAALGNLDVALENYNKALAIAERLAASDPANAQWQRDLWVSYSRLADLAVKADEPRRAKELWLKAFETLNRMKQRGLHISPEDERALEWLREKVSDRES